ncbi:MULTISPECIES: TniB family NTP-binding protein [unclassified Caulobacter]|uniref:TniB family NTP-binding protein n=1 Tax=unclassified Caulobacter TaxID=2648921 RepID=UPI0009E6E269|nr:MULTISPECIES: TniB family NTP-binding protein [unclassified Caulobacter]
MPEKAVQHTEPFPHLHTEVRHLATADLHARRACILTDRWISYPAAEDVLYRLFELLDMPPRVRMPSLLFWAHPNMGKTFIQRHFLEIYSKRGEGENGAVLWMEINDGLTEKRLYLDLLTALNAPAPDATAARLQSMLMRHLKARSINMIMLDELQRATELRQRDQRTILNALKYLSNQLSISIVGFGSGEAKALIESDDHLSERFDVIELPKCGKREKWLVDLVRARVEYFPLRKATSVDRAMMECLLFHSNFLLGRLIRLLERAAIAALDNQEHISADLIEAVATRRRLTENG